MWVVVVVYEAFSRPEDVPTLVTSKLALQYSGSEVSTFVFVWLLCSDWLEVVLFAAHSWMPCSVLLSPVRTDRYQSLRRLVQIL